MDISARIRENRKKMGLTQEQVANLLGVSTPAVNKWEKGATYPDITLLPALARLFRTDLNTLLCFDEDLTQQEVAEFLNDLGQKIRDESIEEGFLMAMEKAKEYPNSGELLHSIALVLEGALLMSGRTEEEKGSYLPKINELYERAAESDDPRVAEKANYMLASGWIARGQFEKAQEKLDLLPQWNALDKRTLQANLWIKEGKITQAAELLERKLLTSVQTNLSVCDQLAKIALMEGDEEAAAAVADCAKKECEAFGLWEYNGHIVALEVAVSRKDVRGSTAALKAMLEAIFTPWIPGSAGVFRHAAQHCADHPGAVGKAILPPLLAELENNPRYDFLRGDEEFQELIREYGGRCKRK